MFVASLSKLVLCLAVFVSSSFLFAFGNGKCCKTHDKLASCSGCIGWDDDGDEDIDWYMDIGNHSGKKCTNGDPSDNCTETMTECASVTNMTKYDRRVAGVCQGANGTAPGPISISVMQCDENDDPCPTPIPQPEE